MIVVSSLVLKMPPRAFLPLFLVVHGCFTRGVLWRFAIVLIWVIFDQILVVSVDLKIFQIFPNNI
jgi:hypothetical protein